MQISTKEKVTAKSDGFQRRGPKGATVCVDPGLSSHAIVHICRYCIPEFYISGSIR